MLSTPPLALKIVIVLSVTQHCRYLSTQHLQSAFRFMTVQNSGKTRKLTFFLYAMQCVFKSRGILSLTQISKIFYDWIVICGQCLTININYY